MKGLLGIIAIFILFYTLNTDSLEGENYILIEKIEDIEIREYKQLIYASYIPKNNKERNRIIQKMLNTSSEDKQTPRIKPNKLYHCDTLEDE